MKTVTQQHIKSINDKQMKMAELVISAINESVDALINKDFKNAKRIRSEDKKINDIRWDIEEDCINLIATHQPVASDLREIIALLNINTELERIGDYAAGIAKIVKLIGDEKLIKPLIDIPKMKDIAVDMIENAMKAYINHNEKSARMIHSQDDDIDEIYDKVYLELINYMIEHPEKISQCTYLMWVTHNLE
ncbi:MAG: phosphate signaling complex protein PhoU, partial [Gracilimonas sp.]